MEQAFDTGILFDDLAVIEAVKGNGYLRNGTTAVNNDCTNNIHDCTNNIYMADNEEYDTAQIA